MRPPRRPRTGARRDGGIQQIRTDKVRYPGVVLPELPAEYRDAEPDGTRLRPARDTGIAVEGRLARERRRRAREGRARIIGFAVMVVVLGAAAIGWRYSSDERAKNEPISATVAAAGAVPARAGAPADDAQRISATTPEQDPTPMFASLGSVQLRLPVPVEKLTEVGFHQASYTYALHMATSLPDANMKEAKTNKGTGRDLTQQETGPAATLTGAVLRMWRSRPGEPDSAVDVGAPAGSDVFAPVSGTIVKIKRYKLYGKYDDYEIHIQPKGRPDIDAVMIHIEDLSCEVGDEVTAGVTRIAAVRKLSDRVNHQLGDYTKGGGDHVHLQLNNAKDERYKGLEDAISVDGS